MPEYERATHEVMDVIRRVIRDHYPMLRLLVPELQIVVLMVRADPGKSALKKHGWPALGIISIVSEKDRAAGGPDVLLQLDGDFWDTAGDEQRAALVDHELYHLEMTAKAEYDDFSQPVRFVSDVDGLGRPVVKIRPHDFEVGGFKDIVERWGLFAPEKHNLDLIDRMLSDCPVLPFMQEKPVVAPVIDSMPESPRAAASKAPRAKNKAKSKGRSGAQAQV